MHIHEQEINLFPSKPDSPPELLCTPAPMLSLKGLCCYHLLCSGQTHDGEIGISLALSLGMPGFDTMCSVWQQMSSFTHLSVSHSAIETLSV